MATIIDKLKKINWKQPKFMLPAILYPCILFLMFFVFRFFTIEKAEVKPSKLQETEYLNATLPEANIKGDGVGDKYSSMLNEFGKITDLTAVDNVEREQRELEQYESQYSDTDLEAMQSGTDSQDEAIRQLQEMQRQIQEAEAERINALAQTQNTQLVPDYEEAHYSGNTKEEEATIAQLNETLQSGKGKVNGSMGNKPMSAKERIRLEQEKAAKERAAKMTVEQEETVIVNDNAVTATTSETALEEVAKVQPQINDRFNTIGNNDEGNKLVKAMVDEEIDAVDGSRVRLKLLDDIEITGRVMPKGSYLYMIMSGFNQQRVKGSIKSVLFEDELVKVSLSIYDMDGLEGLYVPKSAFRDAAQQIGSGAMSQAMNINSGSTYSNSISQWGMQALQNATQKSMNSISKLIRKNKVHIKYGTQVYLINSKQQNNNAQ